MIYKPIRFTNLNSINLQNMASYNSTVIDQQIAWRSVIWEGIDMESFMTFIDKTKTSLEKWYDLIR